MRQTKLKVLMIEHFLPSSPYSEELCRCMADFCDITLLTNGSYVCKDDIAWNCKPVLSKASNNKLIQWFFIVRGWFKIAKELIIGRYNVVHVQTFKSFCLESWIYSLFGNGRVVHTVHNVLPHETKPSYLRKYKKFYNVCNRLIVHNEFCKKLLIKEYGIDAKKIDVIAHGAVASYSEAEYKKDINKFEFLEFGFIRKYKGIDILLKAISVIPKEKRYNLHFTIAGKQSKKLDETDYERMIVDLDISECVTLITERIPENQVASFYNKADACLFPYREIYGSGALLMAYGYAKPVIVSDTPAFVEETNDGETGIVFKNGDYVDLASAIIQFTNFDKDTIDCKTNRIRELVRNKYNWCIAAEKTFCTYQKML